MEVRTRMAPSPTGEYHIGHMRTVLYNYALAKKHGGSFVMRIEDTDRERLVEGATDRILDVITDYGLSWDEGPRVGGKYAPYVQSERLEIYRKYAEELVERGCAYYCFCTPERLAEVRKSQQEQKLPTTKYDKHCLYLSKEDVEKNLSERKPYVIRQKMKDNEVITFHDEVLGDISVNSNDVDDSVLLKSDGYPTYHLAVVVDDHLMNITHIMRGIDWLPSTPKHVKLFKDFGWVIPKLIHLPNLKEKGANTKLSKRFGAVEAINFLEEGYLPEAVLNFLMLIGWNPGGENEIFSLNEFIDVFSIERLHKTDLVAFDRDKLLWMNGYYLRNLSAEDLYEKALAWGRRFGSSLSLEKIEKPLAIKISSLVQDRVKKLSEIEELTSFMAVDIEKAHESLTLKYSGSKETFDRIINEFEAIFTRKDTHWSEKNLEEEGYKVLGKLELSAKEVFMTLRVALTCKEITPPLFAVIEILGRDVVLKRLAMYH